MNHSGNGVTITIDRHSDETIDFTGTVGSVLDDTVAPTTTTSIAGTLNQDGSYLPGAVVTLTVADDEGGIGVDKADYSLDDGNTWISYTSPIEFHFNEVGQTTIAIGPATVWEIQRMSGR